MKIECLSTRTRERCTSMDPFGCLQVCLQMPSCFALCARAGEENTPVGLLVALRLEQRIAIEWMFVEKEWRGLGIGEQLLLETQRIAERFGISEISASIRSTYLEADGYSEGASYFEERLFDEERRLARDDLTLRTISKLPVFKRNLSELPRPRFLISMGLQELQDILERLEAEPAARMLYPVAGNRDLFDRSCSCVLARDGEVQGALLTQKMQSRQDTKGVLVPALFYAKTDEDAVALLGAAVGVAAKKYSPLQRVRTFLYDLSLGWQIGTLLGSSNEPGGRLLIAQTGDIRAAVHAEQDI